MLHLYTPLIVDIHHDGVITRVTVTGEVHDGNVAELIDALGSIRPTPGTTVLVDVGPLAFLGGGGVQALVFTAQRFEFLQCTLVIAGSGGSTSQTLSLLGADPKLLLSVQQAG